MSRERWGAFTSKSHLDAKQLIPEILIYDRLLIPVPAERELNLWKASGWCPDKMAKRLEALGDLAVRAEWEENYEKDYLTAMRRVGEGVTSISPELDKEMSFLFTPWVVMKRFQTVNGRAPFIIPAYRSRAEVAAARLFDLGGIPTTDTEAAVMLQDEFLFPADDGNPEDMLGRVIALAKDETFRKQRRQFYDWQDQVLGGNHPYTSDEVVTGTRDMLAGYREAVRRADWKVVTGFIYTIAGATLGLIGTLVTGNPLPALGSLVTTTKFLHHDARPAVQAGENAPAAMFHSASPILRHTTA